MTIVKNYPKTMSVLLDELVNGFPAKWGKDQLTIPHQTPVNIHETIEGFHVELFAPGIRKEELKVNIENGLLTVSFERASENPNEAYKTIRREFQVQSFKRSFTIDENVHVDGIEAKHENGVLKLYLPKREEIKTLPKQISIL